MKCWGLNYYGELGDGTKTDPSAPAGDTLPLVAHVVIAGPGSASALTGVSAIAVGLQHTCAVLADGTVKCWGWNSGSDDPFAAAGTGGQLGDGTTIDRLAPVTVIAAAGSTSPLSGVRAIAAGWFHTCALLVDGTVKCWGDATFRGGLGDGTAESSLVPVTVIAEAGTSRALSGVTAIAAGDFKTCALLIDSTVTCWGDDYVSQLDTGGSVQDPAPVTVGSTPLARIPLSDVTAIDVAGGFTQDAGGFVACALTLSRTVTCWGNNDFGGLGDGTTTSSRTPVDVVGIPGDVAAITAGCALVVNSTVTCWPGFNADGELENSPFTVTAAEGSTIALSGVTAIASGGNQVCAVLEDGSVACWSSTLPTPTAVPGLLIASPVVTPEPTVTLVPALEPPATAGPVVEPLAPLPADLGLDPTPGDWSVIYGSPSVVTISRSNDSYTVLAKGQIQVTGGSCFLRPGTLIATFSGSGGSYSGQHGLWRTSDCVFANWAKMTLTLSGNTLTGVLADGELAVFTRVGPVVAPRSFSASVPTPADISLDPVIVAQSVVVATAVVVFVPFPGVLFNSTLEANYAEIVGRVRGARKRLNALFARSSRWATRWLRRSKAPSAEEPSPGREKAAAGDFWRTPRGIAQFVLVTALLGSFLDPTLGPDARSLVVFAGLAAGLVVILLASNIPLAIAFRQSRVEFFVRALPGTLAVGVACVLISRLTAFQPGYLYGLVVGIAAAQNLSEVDEGRTAAVATVVTLAVAVVAWFGLWWLADLTSAGVEPSLAVVVSQTALATIVVAGLEGAAIGLMPVRFLPGQKIRQWNGRAWLVLAVVAVVGFLHILVNPRSGYLADSSRTPMVTIVVLLLFFGLGSVAFWAYFRFRKVPVAPSAGS